MTEPADLSLAATVHAHICKVLELCDNNRSKAARTLKIHRRSLLRYLQKHGSKSPESKPAIGVPTIRIDVEERGES
jgi:DNA-binding NtrC family response regulator